MGSKLFFSLDAIKPQIQQEGGTITQVTSKHVPGFVGISFASLQLNPKGVQQPIWHSNANKIGYCLQGNAIVTIRSPGAADTFTVEKGDMFFIPKGYIHSIENPFSEDVSIAFALDHTDPETMCLSKGIGSLSENVFTATFNAPQGFLDGLKKNKNHALIKTEAAPKSQKASPSKYKFNVAASNKPIKTKGGYLQVATKGSLPILEGLGILRFGLNQKGNVEPHWHTNAGELVYIVKGKTRITVLDPAGNVEVLEVNGGQGAFAPTSHFHNIENIGSEEVEVIAFFNHADPDYIGIGEAVGAYSNGVLASTFNLKPNYFDTFKKPSGPLVIVPL